MNGKSAVLIVSAAVLLLFLGAGSMTQPPLGLAQGPGQGGMPMAPAGGGTSAALSAGFTYQGRLRDGAGSPVDDTCDFTFSLWDSLMGGSQVGSNSVVAGVEVSEGHFTAVANSGGEFGADAFTGQSRWLEIAVQCSGDGSPVPLGPRQSLSATPYALSLRPGAIISGTVVGGSSLTVINSDPTGQALYGHATGSGGWPRGVYGVVDGTTGSGVAGWASATSGGAHGVYGVTASTEGSGVMGYAGATEGEAYGVYGQADSSAGRGVYGYASASSGFTYGVFGLSDSTTGAGVYGTANLYGVRGEATVCGVYGEATATAGLAWGVYGVSAATTGQGVYGHASASSGSTYGVSGRSDSTSGRGVYGYASAASGGAYGVYGRSDSTAGRGLYGYADANSGTNYGVYGRSDSPDGYGGYFYGDVHVQGDLSASGTKPFKIDHPLDPANRYLYHYSVESHEVLNQYGGNVILDENGEGWVELPAWFGLINRDFRYQLTPIGAAAPNLYVAQEIQDNRFQIAGGLPGLKVSWQVTALRDDPYVRHYGAPVEVEKPEGERGTYLYPELYGRPEELGRDYQRGEGRPGLMGPGAAARGLEDAP